MLEADGELRLNRKALRSIDFSVGTADPRISEEKRWLSPDESLPSVLPKAVPVFSLMPYTRSEEHTSELQSRQYLVCRLLLEKKNLTGCCAPTLMSSVEALLFLT